MPEPPYRALCILLPVFSLLAAVGGLVLIFAEKPLIMRLCILAVTPLLSLWMTDIRSMYPAYLLWGRSAVRLAIAALLYRLRPREARWEPAGNF